MNGKAKIPQWLLRAFLLCTVCLLSKNAVWGSAWDLEKGHGQVIVTATFLNTSRSFDQTGASHLFPNSGRFRQYSIYTFVEVGLSHRFTLVANTPAPFLRYADNFSDQSSRGFGDVEVGLKYRLNSSESGWAASAQILTSFPAYPDSRVPAPGNHQEDIEARFLLGRSATWNGRNLFWDAEAAYRYRTGDPADQFRGDVTAGMQFAPRWMGMVQVFTIRSMGNGAPFHPTNPNAQSDFDLYKGEVSVVFSATSKLSLQAGWIYAFAGRNTGRDHSLVIGLWRRF